MRNFGLTLRKMTNKYVIIVAAGNGSRMGATLPKQFMLLQEYPVIFHTIRQFIHYSENIRVVVVLNQANVLYFEDLCRQYQFHFPVQLVVGGETRFHSVKNGLNAIADNTALVAIHDAARPLVSNDTIQRAFQKANESGAAVPVVPLNESLRELSGNENKAVSRENYRIIQTPQCFQVDLIKKAFETDYSPEFTDDATVMEKAGYQIQLVEGNPENIKLTVPSDFQLAEAILKNRL